MSNPGTKEYFGVNQLEKIFSCVDLFSGAGGLSLGVDWAGFETIAAVECDKSAADTFDANFNNVIIRNIDGTPKFIENIDFTHLKDKVDLIIGGPPCQGFSTLGKQLIDDPRNALWREYMRAVQEIQPKAFILENVPQILQSVEGHDAILAAKSLGYNVISDVLPAELFGVPQKRRRAFIIGIKNIDISLPKPMNIIRDVDWAFKGLSLKPDEKNWHISRTPTKLSLDRYKVVPPGGNRFDLMKKRPDLTPKCWLNKPTGSTDVFGRLWWDRPALTIRTEFFKPEKGRYLHPTEHRPITHREAARLQTFPDNFTFSGSKTDVAKQIGNAVPPLLAYHVGKLLYKALLEADSTNTKQQKVLQSV